MSKHGKVLVFGFDGDAGEYISIVCCKEPNAMYVSKSQNHAGFIKDGSLTLVKDGPTLTQNETTKILACASKMEEALKSLSE